MTSFIIRSMKLFLPYSLTTIVAHSISIIISHTHTHTHTQYYHTVNVYVCVNAKEACSVSDGRI